MHAVFVKDNIAYCAGMHGLSIFDVSDPTKPRILANVVLPDSAWGIYVSGQYAYLAGGESGLRVIDVSNPSSPREVGYYDTSGYAWGVYVSGRYAYVGDWGSGLRVIDVSNPRSPVEIGFYDTPGLAMGVYVSGSYAYVADREAGLRIIDISNPHSPSELGFCDTSGHARSVYVLGQYAYVADEWAGLRIIDISNPYSPREVGFYDTPGLAHDVYVSGQYAYVADWRGGLRVIDVSNPTSSKEVSSHPGYAYGVCISGQYAYVAYVVDWEFGVGKAGLGVVDVSNPASPREVGFYGMPGWARAVYVSGQYAYVADGDAGLRIIDVSNPRLPIEVGFYDTPGWPHGVYVSGQYAYVGDFYSGLRVIDVSNPASPWEAGFYNAPDAVEGVYVLDQYAYVTAGYAGLRIIDISNPSSPREVGFCDTSGYAEGVYVSGQYAYVAADRAGLRVIDVSNPTSPREVGFYDTPGDAEGVYVFGQYAYVADEWAGLRIIDVSNPSSPREVGYYNAPSKVFGAYVSDQYAYVTDWEAGLRIIDVSNPSSPREVGFYDMPGFASGIYVSGQYAYVAAPAAGLFIFRFTGAVGVNQPPSVPILLSPSEGATVSPTPTFKLKATDPDGDQVKFRIEAKQGGITKVFETPFVASGAEATYTPNQALTDGQWTWRAKAIDRRGAESGWSQERSFTVRRPTIEVNPTSLSFKASQDAKPISQTFKVTNKGNSALNWTATKNENWLTLKPANGTLAIGSSADITVTVDPSNLSPQTYQDRVSIKDSNGSVLSEVTVTLEVLPPLQPGEKFTATVKVVDENGKPVRDAIVRVFNSEHKPITAKATDSNGEVIIKDLMLGYVLRAERKVATFVLNEDGTVVEKTSIGANDRLFYEVFLTSDEVKDDGTIDNDIRGRQDTIVLIIKKTNTLIKFHLELAFEWDADKETVDFWIEALRHASNLLYDVTDGHACIGSVKVLNDYRYPTSPPWVLPRNVIQVLADNDLAPHSWGGIYIGRQWITGFLFGLGRWDGNWQGVQHEFLGTVVAHEMGHSLLGLPDEYKGGKPLCVLDDIAKKPGYDDPDSTNACLMSGGYILHVDHNRHILNSELGEAWFKASELCNVINHNAKLPFSDCWLTFIQNFSDFKNSPNPRWLFNTPIDRGKKKGQKYVVCSGPGKVMSVTGSTTSKSRLIKLGIKKDAIGEEMDVDLSRWKYKGGRKVSLQLVQMPDRRPMGARVGIYSSERFIYQGRTRMEEIEIHHNGSVAAILEVSKIDIEGYHNGDVIEVFALNQHDFFRSLKTPLEVWPTPYTGTWRIDVKISSDGKWLSIKVKIDPQEGKPVSEMFVQMVVQGGRVLDIRDMPLKKVDTKGLEWEGSVPLSDEEPLKGYLRFALKRGGSAVAWASFDNQQQKHQQLLPISIVREAETIRLANGLGFLEAPEATPETTVSFVVTPPFVFGQGELIPRSFAFTFEVLSGDLGSNSKLELVFDPIQQLPEGRELKLYRFSEVTQKWEPTEAELIPTEGIAILSPARSGTYAVMESALPIPSLTLPAGLQMIGIPFKPSRATPTEVFGLGSETIKLARWKPQGGYAFYQPQVQQQDHDIAFIVPGKGYWVKFDNPVTIPQQGGLLPEEGIAISLKAGWNQIANPFLRPLNWSVDEIYVRGSNDEVKPLSEAVKAGWIEDYAWGWEQDENNPFKGTYVLVYDTSIIPGVKGQLEPWKGYWVYAHTDCELILPPPSATKGRGTRDGRQEAKSNGWTMKLVAKVGDESGEAILGVSPGSRGLAIGLPPEPPEGNSNVQVVVLNNGAPLAVDVRNSNARQQVWDVVIRFGTRGAGRGTRKEEVTLTWDGIGYAPKDVSLILVDLANGTRRYMRTQTAYSFVPTEGETERRFKVIAEIGNDRPLRIVGLKATPMRGQGVVIEFALTKPAQVQAEVLTLTGRRIALFAVPQSDNSLRHRIVWRGLREDGMKLPMGTYLVRLTATDEEGRRVQAVTMAQLR